MNPVVRLTLVSIKALKWLWRQPSILLILMCLFYAGNAIAGKLAVGHITPYQITFGRWVAAGIVLFLIYFRQIRSAWPVLRPHWFYIVLMAGLGLVSFNILFYNAAYRTSAINIGILQGSIPIFTLIGALVFIHATKVTWQQSLGLLIGLVGVVTVATHGALSAVMDIKFNLGDLMMIVACAVFAGFAISPKNRPAVTPVIFFAVMCVPASILPAPFAIYEMASGAAEFPTTAGWLILLYIVLFPSLLGQVFFFRSLDLIGPARANMFLNLIPIFAALLAIGLLSEIFRWYHAIALVLVFSGLWLSRERTLETASRALDKV